MEEHFSSEPLMGSRLRRKREKEEAERQNSLKMRELHMALTGREGDILLQC